MDNIDKVQENEICIDVKHRSRDSDRWMNRIANLVQNLELNFDSESEPPRLKQKVECKRNKNKDLLKLNCVKSINFWIKNTLS